MLAILLLPGFLLSALRALAERDWRLCLAQDGRTDPPPSLLAPAELIPVLHDTIASPLTHPLATLLHVGPFVVFALLYRLAATAAARRALLIALAAFLAFCAHVLLSPSGLHDCDRKGTDALILLAGLAPAGALAALFANRLSCIASACRR